MGTVKILPVLLLLDCTCVDVKIISFTHCQPHQSKQVGLFGNVPQVPTAAVISLQANV